MRRAVLTLLLCTVAAACSSGSRKQAGPPFLKIEHDSPPASAYGPVKLYPIPARVAWQCRRVQRRSPFRILCPARLPRPMIGASAGAAPPKLLAQVLPYELATWRNRAQRRRALPAGVSFVYGGPWGPDSGPDWRTHVWRNRPCCFLHFDVFRRPPGRQFIPSGARPAVVGGKLGLLKEAGGYGMISGSGNADLYFGNHDRFLWREGGELYVASLHYFGRRDTLALLNRLVRELRPAAALATTP